MWKCLEEKKNIISKYSINSMYIYILLVYKQHVHKLQFVNLVHLLQELNHRTLIDHLFLHNHLQANKKEEEEKEN